MIVYHGSDANFKHLRISKNLVRHQSTLNNEGVGIYFSTDLSVAKSYGKYVYTLEIANDCICDFTHKNTCQLYIDQIVRDVYNTFSVDLSDYIGSLLDIVIENLYSGMLGISEAGHEIQLCLDSVCSWYENNLSDCKREKIFKYLRNYGKHHLKAYLFNYNIKGIGVLKTVNDDVVKIVNKQEFRINEAS